MGGSTHHSRTTHGRMHCMGRRLITPRLHGRYGVRVYSSSGGFFPKLSPCGRLSASNPYATSTLERTRVWRNRVNGFQISRVAKLVISDVQIVENGARGVEMPGAQGGLLAGPWGSNRLENALFVGSTPFRCSAGACQAQTGMGLEVAAWNRLTYRRTDPNRSRCASAL
jgi:hypothetical protein